MTGHPAPPGPMTVIHCTCERSRVVAEATTRAVGDRIREFGTPSVTVSDLCGLVGERDDRLRRLGRRRRLVVVACHARAVRWLVEAAGIDSAAVEIIDQRGAAANQVVAEVEDLLADTAAGSTADLECGDDWVPWFPVIDRERCTDCGQCASFCLFGVFSTTDAGRVEVTNPKACKTNCPACARVCPEAAVIFPKLDETPFNGEPVTPESLDRAVACVDLSRLADGDVRELLLRRRETAQRRLLRRQAVEQAEAERCACSCSCATAAEGGGALPVLGQSEREAV